MKSFRSLLQLNHSESSRIRHQLSELSRLRKPDSFEARLLSASATLSLIDIQFRALEFLPRQATPLPTFMKKSKSADRRTGRRFHG